MGGRRPDRASAFRLCCSPNGRQVFLYDYSTLGAGLVLLLLLASRLAPTAAGRPRCPPLIHLCHSLIRFTRPCLSLLMPSSHTWDVI